MKCQICKKNTADTHIKKNVNGNVTEMYLCSHCANEMGYNNIFHNDLLSFDNLWGSLATVGALSNPLKCSLCGSTYEDISNTGKVGCENCYNVFREMLMPTIKKIHGNTARYCNDNIKVNEYNELDDLKKQLQTAIQNEEYEKAAEIRDRMKELKGE